MNIVDSSGWLEYFVDGANAPFFAPAIQRPSALVVPTISLYEVFKRVLQERDEGQALRAVAIMQQGSVADLTALIALSAAKLSVDKRLPMADSVMLATAMAYKALLWTQDVDFEGMQNVRYVRAQGR